MSAMNLWNTSRVTSSHPHITSITGSQPIRAQHESEHDQHSIPDTHGVYLRLEEMLLCTLCTFTPPSRFLPCSHTDVNTQTQNISLNWNKKTLWMDDLAKRSKMRPFRVTSPKNLVSPFKALFHSCTHINISHSLLNFLWRARALQGRLRIQCSLRDSSMVARQSVPTGRHGPASAQTFPLVSQPWAHIQGKMRPFMGPVFRVDVDVCVSSQHVCSHCLRCMFYAWVRGTQLCGSDTQIAPSLSWSREQHLSMTSIWARIHTHTTETWLHSSSGQKGLDTRHEHTLKMTLMCFYWCLWDFTSYLIVIS